MTLNKFYERKTCRVCESENIETVVKLASSPPGNNFVSKDNLNIQEEEFPLELRFCNDCFHIQLGHVVDPEFLFQNNYSYVSSTSEVFVEHLSNYADHVISRFNLSPSSFVVDIGSNDGTCLSFFKEKKIKVLGVDPATEIAALATKNGLETLACFFNKQIAERIVKTHGKSDLVTSHNACAHIDDLASVIEGVEILLEDEGVFVMEVGYFVDVFENKWFDTIYHEHVDFHTIYPLVTLFNRFQMEIFRVERISPQGGSIRVMVQKTGGPHYVEDSVEELIALESDLGLHDSKSLKSFEETINKLRKDFRTLIDSIKREGKSIAAFGAPTKATTLCHHFDINNSDIDFIVDDNPLKQGLFSPGTHIPVYDPKKIYEVKPDYLLILAWNFASPIMKNHAIYEQTIGSFILPMPIPRIVD